MAQIYAGTSGQGENDFADGSSTQSYQPENFSYGSRVDLTAGTAVSLGSRASNADTTAVTIKVALYDSSRNLVVDDSYTLPGSGSAAWRDTGTISASVSTAEYTVQNSSSTNKAEYHFDSAEDGRSTTVAHASFPEDPADAYTTESATLFGCRVDVTAAGGTILPQSHHNYLWSN